MSLLEKVKYPVARCLVENKISWHPTHILSSVNTLITLVLPAKRIKTWH
jgi:hypothetical protein